MTLIRLKRQKDKGDVAMKSEKNRKLHTKHSPGSVICSILKYMVLLVGCALVIMPIIVILFGAFKDNREFSNTGIFELPQQLRWENFATAFIQGNVLTGLKNTFIILIISCAGSVITGTMTAFVIQRFKSVLTRTIRAAFLVATLLPNISMQVTVYQIINKLGLMDTMAAPIILYVGTDIISIYIFIQFLNQIPVSLDESGIVDGASYPRIYFSIILPNLTPAIATVVIIKFVSIYNDFYTPQLYMKRPELSVVSTALYNFVGPFGAKWEIIFAGILLAIIPTLIIFLTLQKYIYSGLVSGSVKE